MIETDRVLRPLREAEPAIEQLDTYESPAVLTEALRATWHAVDRTLRTLLRSDASAPDAIRLTAMSPEQMTSDAVMLELRRRDFITLGLAGRIHELRQALARAESGGVRAADADNALEVVRRVTEEVHGVARRATDAAAAAEDTAGSEHRRARTVSVDEAGNAGDAGSAAGAGARGTADAAEAGRRGPQRRWTLATARPLLFAGAAVLVLAIAVAAVFFLSDSSEVEKGIAAFGEERTAAAEQHFRAALQEDTDNNTARLYLARILRRESRHEEAAQLLQAAAAQDPDDPAVRRELGYLFLDLGRPGPAAGQFRRAVEIDADDPLNWAGIVHALRSGGDSTGAEEWLRRAPAGAREMMAK